MKESSASVVRKYLVERERDSIAGLGQGTRDGQQQRAIRGAVRDVRGIRQGATVSASRDGGICTLAHVHTGPRGKKLLGIGRSKVETQRKVRRTRAYYILQKERVKMACRFVYLVFMWPSKSDFCGREGTLLINKSFELNQLPILLFYKCSRKIVANRELTKNQVHATP